MDEVTRIFACGKFREFYSSIFDFIKRSTDFDCKLGIAHFDWTVFQWRIFINHIMMNFQATFKIFCLKFEKKYYLQSRRIILRSPMRSHEANRVAIRFHSSKAIFDTFGTDSKNVLQPVTINVKIERCKFSDKKFQSYLTVRDCVGLWYCAGWKIQFGCLNTRSF